MDKVNFTIRINSALKKDADAIFKASGLTMTKAFYAFADTTIRERRLPFDISALANGEKYSFSDSKLTIRMDGEMKRQFDEAFSDMCLSTTAGFVLFCATTIRLGKIPFDI